MMPFQAALGGFVEELGGRRAAFQFHVLVVGVGQGKTQLAGQGERRAQFALQVVAGLFQVDAHVVRLAVRRYAVVVFQAVHRHAEKAGAADPGQAGRAAFGAGRRVGYAAVG
ncbi:hypothetical protein, partial [Methylogaea oryzae]|uniref:hypothetical protein n=1 Tax=Methylogaea oryzae TaxID=1295382 RepID=UPI001C3F2615